MVDKERNIIELVEKYVFRLLSEKLPEGINFHNITHTEEVVKAAIEIAIESNFTDEQLEIVTLAAWFHDTGYTTTLTNHEDSSKAIATEFLQWANYPKESLDKILACIEATRFPQNPKSAEGHVLADADLYHFTKPDYPKYEQRLRKEFEILCNKTYSNMEWAETNYILLKNHNYYTDYGKIVLQKFKEVNIKRLEILIIKKCT